MMEKTAPSIPRGGDVDLEVSEKCTHPLDQAVVVGRSGINKNRGTSRTLTGA